MPRQLTLSACPHRALFREIVRQFQVDPALKRVTKTWFVWDGTPRDVLEIAVALCPAISLTPSSGPDSFYGPSGFRGSLVVRIGLAVAGTCADDLLDYYHACRRALYPKDDTLRVSHRNKLVELGALTGEPLFTSPQMGVASDDSSGVMLTGVGQVRLELRTIDP